jgi:sulfate adenylyltransferase
MNSAQYKSCLENMRLGPDVGSGVFPIPINCSLPEQVDVGTVVSLKSATGVVYAELTVAECWPIDLERESVAVFGCFEKNHPYTQYQLSKTDKFYVSGDLAFKTGITYHNTFLGSRKTPAEIKAQVDASGKPLIAFQTRNPLHRSHIELIKASSLKVPDAAVMLHPVEGVTQECDIPFPVRMNREYNKVTELDEEEQQQILALHGVATGNTTVKEVPSSSRPDGKTPIKRPPGSAFDDKVFDTEVDEEEEFTPVNLDDDRELSVPEWMLYESH